MPVFYPKEGQPSMDDLTLNEPAASSAAAEIPAASTDVESGFLLDAPAPDLSTPTGDTPAENGEAGDRPTAQDRPTAEKPGDTSGDPPFHEHPRWQEVQTKLREAEAENARLKTWEPVLQQFRDAGMGEPAAVQEAVRQQAEQTELRRIAEGVWAEVEAGTLSEDAAEERFQRIQAQREFDQLKAQLASQQAQQQQGQSQQARAAELAAQLPALARLYPEMDESDVREIALRTPGANLTALAKLSHDKAVAVIARYNARAAQRPAVAVEGGGGAPSSSGKTVADMSREEFDQYYKSEIARAETAGRY
jgi:hypothetical protein